MNLARLLLIAFAAISLPSCASVAVFDRNGTDAKGFHYYLPAPYLLVLKAPDAKPAANPKPPVGGGEPGLAAAAAAPGGAKGKKPPTPPKPPANNSTDTTPKDGAPTTASLTAFAFTIGSYQFRIIYLPDKCKEYSVEPKLNPFYSTQFSPKFTDGWMLSGIDSTATNEIPSMISSLASLAGAVATKATPAANVTPALTASAGATLDANKGVLPPGLYRFDYNGSGTITGISQVKFTEDGAEGSMAPDTCARVPG